MDSRLKGGTEMDKILVMTDHSETDGYLVQCLNLLFPECKIEMKQRQTKSEDTCSQRLGDDENKKEAC